MEVLKNQGGSVTQVPRSWLMPSEVRLDGPDERDMMVVATGPLQGANITTFWVLRPSGHGFKLLLTTLAHDLFIRRTRSKGYKDIETVAATAVRASTVQFKFDGNRYNLYARSSKAIR